MTASSAMPDVWLAPAKLNLFLRVTGRRKDGYHSLQTAFVFLDHYDRLQFELNHSGDISRVDVKSGIELVLPEQDLCVKAAQRLKQYCGVDNGATICLEKRLPAGAGLGGGSSDAATVLIALNRLWGANLPLDKLVQLGRELGADVPVFIHGQNTIAEGVGDEFQPFDAPEQAYCVLIPKIHVSTGEIFSDSSLTHATPIKKIRGSLLAGLGNDLQAITCRRYPEVKKVLDWLHMYGDARMSGTGASVFIACDTLRAAKKILHQSLAEFGDLIDGFAAHSLVCHPHK